MDDLALIVRSWSSQDRIATQAWSIARGSDLDPELGQRVQRAASEGADDELLRAVGDLLAATEEAAR